MAQTFSFDGSAVNTKIGFQGILKDINGVNGSPISIAPGFPDLEDQMNQMGIVHIRCHDNLGYGDLDNYFVANDPDSQFLPNIPVEQQANALSLVADLGNIRTIFPNAAVGMRSHNITLALSGANYSMTDKFFKRILDNHPTLNPTNINREIMFRIGRTNRGGHEIPEDFDIYATLTAELVKRYSLNYQLIGLPRRIKYWEIWNEPDLTIFWNNNDPEQYYEFYAKVARAIKKVDPTALIGGAGVAAGYNPGSAYLDGLLGYCKKNNIPLDFLSWHYYANTTADPQNFLDIGQSIDETLNKYGFNNAESLCTEWNSTPFAKTSILSKLQSAENAAYIASSLIYMNHTRCDKAYYYRGDASSFGLFNKQEGFCTYSAQAFHLYNQMFETPLLLNGPTDFSSGLTTLAGINPTGNKINVLAANYEVNMSLVVDTPNQYPAYPQYYVDGNRQVSQLTDEWSLNKWFMGTDPRTIYPNNSVWQHPVVTQLPNYGDLKPRPRNYTNSRQGLQFSIQNVNSSAFTVKAWRIKEGGPLWRMTPEEVSSEVTSWRNGNTITVFDPRAVSSTVTLYSIIFDNNRPITVPNPTPTPVPPPPAPTPEPSQSLIPPGCTAVPGGSGDVIVTTDRTYALTKFLPYEKLDKSKTYYLRFAMPPGGKVMSCPDGKSFRWEDGSCVKKSKYLYDFEYNIDNGMLILYSNIVNMNFGESRYYVSIPKEALGSKFRWQLSVK